MISFRASLGALAWLSAEQIWIRNREQAVVCVQHAVEHQEQTGFDKCDQHFQNLEFFDTLKNQVEAKNWEAATETMHAIGLQEKEADAALGLFKISHDTPLVGSAYEVWGAAIQETRELAQLSDDFETLLDSGEVNARQRQIYLSQLDQITQQLERQEQRFALLLNEANRRAELFGLLSTVGAVLLLLGLGAFYWRQAKFRELERSAVERRLAVQERTFVVLVENLREAVCAVNPATGRVQYANPAFWNLIGYESGSALRLRDFVEMEPDEIDDYLNLSDHQADTHVEQTWRGRDDASLAMQVLVTRIETSSEHETLFFLARNVTEQREMEAHMMDVDRIAAVGTLAAGVGHEINNPLTFVAGGLDYATIELQHLGEDSEIGPKDAERLAEVKEALEDARDGTTRVRDIVRDLKTFSRRDPEDTVEPIDVEAPLETAVDMAMSEIRHRARLHRDYRANQPVMANESRLAQVFLNLLINGAHAMEEGSVEDNELSIVTYREGDEIVVEVRDTGTGIAKDQYDMIFEPFRTSKPVDKGTGLGLAISRNIVEALGGSLTFDSTLGEGTTFYVRLPVAHQEAEPSPTTSATARFDGEMRVLIIDDEARLCRSLRRTIEQRGAHRVGTVLSAAEALAKLDKGEQYDVIFCDILMPEMSGIDFYEALDERHPRVLEHLVFMTGGAFTDRTREFAEVVPNRVLSKPFDLDELGEILDHHRPTASPQTT
ncbi:MAG: ATP-binding protein [Myxococcota bacterium]